MSEYYYQAFRTDLSSGTRDFLNKTSEMNENYKQLLSHCDEWDIEALTSYDQDFMTRFTCNSAAIEGSTLTELDTVLVLEGDFVPSDNKEVSDMFAIRGIAEGYDYALQEALNGRAIDATFIKDIHERTALDSQPRVRGVFRQSAARINGMTVKLAEPSQVPVEIDDLLYSYTYSELPLIANAAIFHALFEKIHPFADRNGRTGRTIMNVMLVLSDFPPVVLKNADRRTYLATLNEAQLNDNFNPLIQFVSSEICAELDARTKMITETRNK